MLLFVQRAAQAVGQQRGEFFDDRQRRAELVRYVVDKTVRGFAQLHQPLVFHRQQLVGVRSDVTSRPRSMACRMLRRMASPESVPFTR